MTRTGETSGGHGAVTGALFLCLFAAQAALIAMSPVLADAASDLHVATAAAGQLRTITGLAAGITALGLGAVAARVGLGRQLLAASALLAVGSLASAAAPTFALLAVALIGRGAFRLIGFTILQQMVDNPGNFMRGGNGCLLRSFPRPHRPVKGADRRIRTCHRLGGLPKGLGRAVDHLLRARAQHRATRDVVAGC